MPGGLVGEKGAPRGRAFRRAPEAWDTHSMSVRAALDAVLQEDQVAYEVDEARGLLRVPGLAPEGDWLLLAQWSENDDELVAYAVCTLAVPAPRRAAVMEFITRANFGLKVGCFELDLDDGELRFRASVDFEGATVQPAQVRGALFTGVATLRAYLPGLADVVEGADVKATLAAIEARR